MDSPPYALWSIWKQLSFWEHLYLLVLGVATADFLVAAISVTIRLHGINRNRDHAPIDRYCVIELQRPCAHLRQVIAFSFYLFGGVLFLGLQSIIITVGDGRDPVGLLILDNFVRNSAFATNVFLVLLLLHVIQWAVSSRVDGLLTRRAINPE